jgi:hypothetical protein
MRTLAGRLDRAERTAEETMLRPMRERVHRVMRRLGGTLPAAEVEEIVVRYARAERWMRPWIQHRVGELRAQRMNDEQIREAMVAEFDS